MCFVEAVEELARKAGCKLTICPQAENRNDRWIQVSSTTGSPAGTASSKEIPMRTQGSPTPVMESSFQNFSVRQTSR